MIRTLRRRGAGPRRGDRRRAGRRRRAALVGCGENLPDQKIVIVDPETLTACPAGRVGEIWVQGPSVAQGYWQQPEATRARRFRARLEATRGEGPFPAHRRPGIPARRRIVRHRPAERPDHRPRRQLLSAGHRADGAAEPSAAAARLRRGVFTVGGRRPRAAGRSSRRSSGTSRRTSAACSTPFAAPWPPSTNWRSTRSC